MSENTCRGADVRLVIVGHLGFGTEITPSGRRDHLSGSVYGCARGAEAVATRPIGLAADVGDDFPMESLRRQNLSLSGISVYQGPSPRFLIVQRNETERRVSVDLGAASKPHAEFRHYPCADHVHLATMPPDHQLSWYSWARRKLPRASISVDMFEATVRSDPDTSIRLCQQADLAFMNEDEYRVLVAHGWTPDGPIVLKQGSEGARYVDGRSSTEAAAPKVHAVDTTGAGEVLAGAFLALRSEGVDVREALTKAVRLASQSVTHFGVDGPLTV